MQLIFAHWLRFAFMGSTTLMLSFRSSAYETRFVKIVNPTLEWPNVGYVNKLGEYTLDEASFPPPFQLVQDTVKYFAKSIRPATDIIVADFVTPSHITLSALVQEINPPSAVSSTHLGEPSLL